MRVLIAIYSALLLTACGYDDFDEPIRQNPPEPKETIALRSLLSFYKDRPVTITEDVLTWGYVSSSDADGNFYHTLVIEQEDAAIEIKAGLYSLYTLYPEGTLVKLAVKGLCISPERGIMQIGPEAGAEALYPVAYFKYKPLLDKHLTRTDETRIVTPQLRTIASLGPTDYGHLIRVEGLKLKYISGEIALYEDSKGAILGLYISQYSKLNSLTLPAKAKSLCGIMEGRSVDKTPIFTLKPRYVDDIKADL